MAYWSPTSTPRIRPPSKIGLPFSPDTSSTPDGSDGADPYLRELAQVYLPNRVLVSVSEAQAEALAAQVPWLENKRALGGAPTAYVCEARVCDLPARTTDVFAKQIRKKAEPYP